MQRKGSKTMKRQLMKRGMMGIYAVICAGMLLVTGCAGTETNTKTETERMFLPILHLTNNLILAKLIPPFQKLFHPCQQIHRFRQTGFLPERLTRKIYIMYRHPQQVLVAKTPYSGIDPTDSIFFRNSGIKTK